MDGSVESCRRAQRLDFGCDRCSVWPVTNEFRCGRAGERSALKVTRQPRTIF